MNLTALRRPRHGGRITSARLTHDGRRRREPPVAHPAAQLSGRWTLSTDGRLALAWSLRRPAPISAIASEEAMPDPDDSRSRKPGALARPRGLP